MDNDTSEDKKPLKLTALALELGFSIALPIVVLALVGRLLDKQFDTSPLLLLAGILVSIIVSTILLVRKMKSYL